MVLSYMWVLAILNRRAENSAKRDDQKLLAWLEFTEFDRGFYLDLEELVRSEGDEALADEIFLRRRRKEFELARPNKALFQGGWHWIWNHMLDLCFGYGVRTKRIWYSFLLMLLFNTAVFSDPRSVERPLAFVQEKDVAVPFIAPSAVPEDPKSSELTPPIVNAVPAPSSSRATVVLSESQVSADAQDARVGNAAATSDDKLPAPDVTQSIKGPAVNKAAEPTVAEGMSADDVQTQTTTDEATAVPTVPGNGSTEVETTIPSDMTKGADGSLTDPNWSDDGGKGPDEWGAMDGLFMALRVQLPLLPLIAESDWEPASREIFQSGIWKQRWLSYENYASLMIIINLIFFPLLIAGATGIMKRLK